jgi:hypothetical protein
LLYSWWNIVNQTWTTIPCPGTKEDGDFEYKFGVKKALKPVETDALKVTLSSENLYLVLAFHTVALPKSL